MTDGGLHPDVAITHLDRADRYVVRPQVERAAAFKIEASVVPMTGQNAVVECEHAPAVVDDENRAMATVHDEPPLRLQLFKVSRKREFLGGRVHEHNSRSHSFVGAVGTPST